MSAAKLLEVTHLKQYFPVRSRKMFERYSGYVHAVDDVSIHINVGETLGLVGESGCGKSTLLRTVARLNKPDSGEVKFGGIQIATANRRVLRNVYQDLQLVFQDPFASLNPRKRVGQIIAAPLQTGGMKRSVARMRVRELLTRVGLAPEHADRYPHEFSGGQRQRIGLARALVVNPKLILLDEPVSALDVSVQAQVVNLLEDLQRELDLAYLFVAHDLGVMRQVSDRIAVMYLGKLMELAPAEELYLKPIHPYTEALLAVVPIPDPKQNRARLRGAKRLQGEVPSPINPPKACRFNPRCPFATEVCRQVEPPLVEYGNGHIAACHHPQNITAEEITAAHISTATPLSAGRELPSLRQS